MREALCKKGGFWLVVVHVRMRPAAVGGSAEVQQRFFPLRTTLPSLPVSQGQA